MARWRSLAMMCPLFRRVFQRRGQRLGAGPAMLGDIEQHTLGAVEFLLEIAGLMPVLPLVDVVLGAHALELFFERLDVFDQHAEMMQAAIIHALAELVGLELQDRHVERAVAEEHAIGQIAVRPADFLEVEGLLVELGHRLGIFGGDRDVTELGHGVLPNWMLDRFYHVSAESESSARSRARFLPTSGNASSRVNRPNLSNSGRRAPPRNSKKAEHLSVFGSGSSGTTQANSAKSLSRRYSLTPSGVSASGGATRPVSSASSRAAAATKVSPGSTPPFGISQR